MKSIQIFFVVALLLFQGCKQLKRAELSSLSGQCYSRCPASAPFAPDIFPENGVKNRESIISLNYGDANGDVGHDCALSNLVNLTITSPCVCDNFGACSVGVTGATNYTGPASFDYTVTANGDTSNVASAYFSIKPPASFVSVWRVGAAGYGDGSNSITLPLKPGFYYNFIVDWGDGTTETITGDIATHSYAQANDYTVKISGAVEAWDFSLDTSLLNNGKIISVVDLGDVGWKDLGHAFYRCNNLASFAGGKTSFVENMYGMFRQTSGLTSLDLSHFDTSSVTNMSRMFDGASGLTSLDISTFNTSAVTDMSIMFQSASGLTSLDLSNFDTSSVTSLYGMFINASGLTNLDLSNFDTSSVTDMRFMFQNASGLTNLTLSSFNTSAVTDMSYMFRGASLLTNLELSNFDTSSVISMKGMFQNASSLDSLSLSTFNTSSVTDISYMFFGTSGLGALDANNWIITNVTNSTSIWDGTGLDLSLDVLCDQGGSPGTGDLFGATCNY